MNSRLLRLSTARGSGTDLMTVGPAKVKACKSVILCVLVSVFKEFALSFFLFSQFLFIFTTFWGRPLSAKFLILILFAVKKLISYFCAPPKVAPRAAAPLAPPKLQP